MKAPETDADDLKELRDELERIISDGTEVWQRQDRARKVRFNLWDGQSDDGRKHREALGEEPRPFEGSADTRVPLIDDFVNEKKRIAKQAFFRSDIQAVPVEPGDTRESQPVTTLLKWLRDRKMRAELRTEVELSAEHLYGDDPGLAIVEVKWLQDTMQKPTELAADELAVMYATGEPNPDSIDPADPRLSQEMLFDFADLVTNDLRTEEFTAWLAAAFPGVAAKALKRAARELRKTGRTMLPVPVLRQNRPAVETLKYMDEVFFPVGTADIQRARSIHRREWLSEVELRERAVTMGWDADLIEEIVKKGRGQTLENQSSLTRANDKITLSASGKAVDEHSHLFEIWWSYERRADELGIAGLWCFVWSSVIKDRFLKAELTDYAEGKYPFVVRPRERLGRQLTDTRGLGRAIETHQYEVKVQRDCRSDATQVATLPPYKVKIYRGAHELIMGPGAQLPVQKMDDLEQMQPPPFPQASIEMEKTTKAEAMEYVGRPQPGEDPSRAALITQDEADNVFTLWAEVFQMVLQFCGKYYSAEELARITGSDTLTPEDLIEGWDLMITIDARDLNLEFAMKKLKAFGDLAALDAGGVLDKAPLIAWAAHSFDPVLAARAVRPSENVTQKEINETKNAIAQMAAGIEPDMPVSGINAQLRMQTLMQTVGTSPRLQQQIQGDELFRGLVDNYQKYLTQQLVQDQNKIVGRLGVNPMQAGPQSAALGAA